ncbi:MAG: hypothetical protein JST11_11850 [Acidobacteria bacterium]|nr:hypothetical protein [Acidobacteriota bacterium]
MRRLILAITLCSGAAVAQSPATGQFLLRLDPTRPGFTLQNMTPEEVRLGGQHVQYLKSLFDSGKLSLAGQVFDAKGLWGMVIVNAPDEQTARALLEGDPSVKAKMFRGEVMPLRVVFERVETAKASPAVSTALEGDWEGVIETGGGSIRAVVHFRNQPDQTVKATLDSPDQGAMGLALSDVVQKGSSIEFQFRTAKGAYKGELNKEGTLITGQWTQGGAPVPLNLKKAAAK